MLSLHPLNRVVSYGKRVDMASRFVVAVALFAVCHSSPAVRNGRSYGIASSSGPGTNKASASSNYGRADAFGSNDNSGSIARDAYGYGLIGQAFAKATNDDAPEGSVRAGEAQPAYYPVPAPATVVTYQQYADVPQTPSQIVYEQGPLAQSVASSNGGIADSNANIGYGSLASNTRVQGDGSASSFATNSGIVTPIASNESPESSIIAAKTQRFNTVYTPVQGGYGAASSNANVNGHFGSATSSAKTSGVPTRKSISWRFGTAYDGPASYFRSGPSYPSYNSANANANVNSGQGVAKSTAQINAGSSLAKSAVNSNSGYANANANVNNAGYAVIRSTEDLGYGYARTAANSYDQGDANANAVVNSNGINSATSTHGNGSAKSSANSGPGIDGRNAAVNAHSSGFGNSFARTQGISTGYRVVDTNANSHGTGSALSNAYYG